MRVPSVRPKKLFFTVCVIVYCLKIIGLAPFHVPIGNTARINAHEIPIQAFFYSKVGLIYNILLVIPVTVVTALRKVNPLGTLGSNKYIVANLRSAITNVERILPITACCIIIITWAFKQKSAVCVINRLLEIDVRLSSLKKRPLNKRALILIALHIILNAFLWIIYLWLIIVYSAADNLLIEFFIRLPGFINHWFIIEYITVVGVVSRNLETVNKYLLDFKQFGSYLSRQSIRDGILVVSVANRPSSRVASLKLLRSIRTTLYELCEDIADFFSLPILFCIANFFVLIFERLYKIPRAANDSPAFSVCWMLVFVLKYIYPVVALTLNITRTKNEVGLTGMIVHKLLAKARTEEIKAELEQFSLQILHEKLDFTAYGLFTLDSTLLQSMLAGVASYVIILMQFGTSDCNCKDTSTDLPASLTIVNMSNTAEFINS